MAETALNFGPEWLRALSHGNSAPSTTVPETPLPKYKLAQYRYGREEMLALFSKDLIMPEALKEFDYLVSEKCQIPLALLPVTEEEQRNWARSVNSDAALRVSGKGPVGQGNGMLRGGRGGSVDRGRGRGRGGYYQRGITFDENDDAPPPGGFSRLRTLERSQSVSEKDQRWDERDRRLDRPFTGRSGILEDSGNLSKQDPFRPSSDSWRRNEKDDDSGWRTSTRGMDKYGGRTLWRTPNDRDRMRSDVENKDKNQGREPTLNGPSKNIPHHPRQRSTSGHLWDDDISGDNLPEWSVEESAVTDVVGTFDSSGAFMETKMSKTSFNSEEIYTSDDEDCVKKKDNYMVKPEDKLKSKPENPAVNEVPSIKPPVEPKGAQASIKKDSFEKPPVQSSKSLYIEKTSEPPEVTNLVPRTTKPNISARPEACPTKDIHSETVVPETAPQTEELPGPTEEDAFAHHKKATENMMAQWTEEEEQKVASESVIKPLPSQHEDAQKWFYQDPQAEIQGPFTSAEMYEWFKAGYFAMDLLVRRGCDERFLQLGDLIQSWGRIPFSPGTNPPPLQITTVQPPITTPVTQPTTAPIPTSTQPPAQLTQTDAQLRIMQQQMFQQLMQQQLLLRQAQLQQLTLQLKQQESFAKLNPQQQNQAIQQLVAQQQQQIQRPNVGSLTEQSVLEAVPPVPFPLMGLTMPPLMKNDLSLWNIPPTSGTWPIGQSPTQPPGGSIWDPDTPIEVSELEKQQKIAAEEEEKRRQAMEAVKKLEDEKKRQEEEERKQQEAERLRREIQRQQEEEKRRIEELKRLQEEEQRRQEEIRRLDEKKKEEERQLAELRKQEELKKQEEEKRQAELEEMRKERQRQEEQKRFEEHCKREEERKRKEQLQKIEQERLELERQEEAKRLKEQEALKQKEAEKQWELQQKKEAEKQWELQQKKEVEKQWELQQKKEAEKQELQQVKENNQRLLESKGPVWGVVPNEQPSGAMSLSDIQKLQEEKEREEKERVAQQRLQQQQLLLQQQNLKQVQASKNGLSWAKRSSEFSGTVKSLAEIQQEETQRLVQQQQKSQKTAASTVQAPVAAGVWGNSSQINKVFPSPVWTSNISNNTGSFWDDALKSSPAQKPTKNSDSAFPALSNSAKPANVNSNKSKNVRAKKDEEAVLKLFETHRKPTDEFTAWCTDAVSHLPSSVDVPTFVAFLKDVECPYEVFDYVRSYLGESKEAREFGKQFLERRSKFRNQVKQALEEENMWGPAPAITPPAKSANVNDSDATTCTKGKAKKKRNKMHKLDSSMLGFTVQPNPDRINVGEIDRVEGM